MLINMLTTNTFGRSYNIHQGSDKLLDYSDKSNVSLSVARPSQKSQENEKKLHHLTAAEKSVVLQK